MIRELPLFLDILKSGLSNILVVKTILSGLRCFVTFYTNLFHKLISIMCKLQSFMEILQFLSCTF